MKTYAVIPAAGLGSRLGASLPKILLPLNETETVLSILYRKLSSLVDHIHIIASPTGAPLIQEYLTDTIQTNRVSISIQSKPSGMGDAIFQSYEVWSDANRILVIWGDQVFVSENTLKEALQLHAGHSKNVVVPLTDMMNPYVEYIFDEESRLINIKLTREGDICGRHGLADTGTFILSVKELLLKWNEYTNTTKIGALTGEINFLPFFPFLVTSGWQFTKLNVKDNREARGINTQDDLLFFQELYSSKAHIV